MATEAEARSTVFSFGGVLEGSWGSWEEEKRKRSMKGELEGEKKRNKTNIMRGGERG